MISQGDTGPEQTVGIAQEWTTPGSVYTTVRTAISENEVVMAWYWTCPSCPFTGHQRVKFSEVETDWIKHQRTATHERNSSSARISDGQLKPWNG